MTNPQIFVHIGFPKCASSSIQAHFAEAYDTNRLAGLCYPFAARTDGGYRSHNPLFERNLSNVQIDEMIDAILAEAKGCDRVLISSETGIGKLRHAGELTRLLARLTTKVSEENVQLITVVRNHFDFAESCYAQFLKGGLFGVKKSAFFSDPGPTIARYFETLKLRDGIYPFDYTSMFSRIREEVQTLPIHTVSMHASDLGNDLITHLCHMLDVPEPGDGQNTTTNVRFSTRALLALSYGFEHHPPSEVTQVRRKIAARFSSARDYGWSPVLQVADELEQTIRDAQLADQALFDQEAGSFRAVLSPPSRTRNSDELVSLRPRDKGFVDRVVRKHRN